MRWYILRTLLHKEVLRHLANRGGIALVLLLVVASMLLSFFGTRDTGGGGLTPGVQRCYVDYWEDGPLVAHPKTHVRADLTEHVRFRSARNIPTDAKGTLLYPPG